MFDKLINIKFFTLLLKNKDGILLLILSLSLAANWYLYNRYQQMVEESIMFERERVKKFDEIINRLIEQQHNEKYNFITRNNIACYRLYTG